MNKQLFHNLESELILFKSLNIFDAVQIHEFASDKDVSRYIGWSLMDNLEDTKQHVEEMIKKEELGTHLYASILLKNTQKIIGTAMIFNFDNQANHAEIGYVFHKDYWGNGYGTQAVELMSDFAFKILNLHKLHARIVDKNIGSVRILERNGFDLEGKLKDYYFIDGDYCHGLFFGKITGRLSCLSEF